MPAKYNFSGSLALVTGGGSGMGRAVAQQLADAGATVVVADINDSAAAETVNGLKGSDHIAHKLDVASESSVQELADAIRAKYKRVPSVVIHAAGVVSGRRQSVFQIEFSDLNRIIDINLKGTFLINKTFGKLMRDEKIAGGVIVNFSSVAGRHGAPVVADYSASKAGVNSLTESFGRELAPFGIRVNAVAPFFIDTPMLQAFHTGLVDQFVAASPSKRMGTVQEVVDLCLFLASTDSSFITGQIIHVTGGF